MQKRGPRKMTLLSYVNTRNFRYFTLFILIVIFFLLQSGLRFQGWKKNPATDIFSGGDVTANPADLKFVNKKFPLPFLRKVYTINNIAVGGANKYITDIMNLFPEVEFITVTQKSALNVSALTSHDIVYVNHILFTDFTVADLIQLKSKMKAQLAIVVHDTFLLTLNTTLTESSVHGAYLLDIKINPAVCQLFQVADVVIHQSNFSLGNFHKHCPSPKFVAVFPNDYKINRPNVHYRPLAKNKINLGILTRFSVCKGQEIVKILQNIYQTYKGHQIKWKISGLNIKEYGETLKAFEDEIVNHNINGLLYLSRYGETYSYAMTKYLMSGLPILYNNIGSFKERLVNYPGIFPVFQSEHEYEEVLNALQQGVMTNSNFIHLCKVFEYFLDSIISNAPALNLRNNGTRQIYDENLYYRDFYKQLFVPNFSQKRNLFIITSKIFVSDVKFSYSPVRSIYSKEERFKQTLETIRTIRSSAPNSMIVLMDNSVFPKSYASRLREEIDVFLNPKDETLNYYTDHYEYKGFAEVAQLVTAYNMFLHQLPMDSFTNVFKISGRYTLVPEFNISYYDSVDDHVFKRDKQLDYMKYYYTCFYKISPKKFHSFFQSMKDLFVQRESFIKRKVLNLEEQIPIMINYNFTEASFLGVRQNIAVWNLTAVV